MYTMIETGLQNTFATDWKTVCLAQSDLYNTYRYSYLVITIIDSALLTLLHVALTAMFKVMLLTVM